MDREEINAALCARIGAAYHPPLADETDWSARARRFEVVGAAEGGARRLDYLQVRRSGNFGNNYIQLVHALTVAEARGVKRVLHRFNQFASHKRAAGPRLSFRRQMAPDRTGLAGTFFVRGVFQDLADLPPAQFLRVSNAYVRPALLVRQPGVEKGLVALNLRGGADVFDNPAPNDRYGQPPLSYYQKALTNLMVRRDVSAVNLVHQDDRNPVLAPLIAWLGETGLPWRATSAGMLGDAEALMAAEHVVMGWTTFTSALALLSNNMRTVTAFRKAPLFDEMCVAAEAAYLVSDAGGAYFAADGWKNDAAQRRQMVEYPVEALSVEDRSVKRRRLAEALSGYQTRRRARLRRWTGR